MPKNAFIKFSRRSAPPHSQGWQNLLFVIYHLILHPCHYNTFHEIALTEDIYYHWRENCQYCGGEHSGEVGSEGSEE
jgi:hypothetical protein